MNSLLRIFYELNLRLLMKFIHVMNIDQESIIARNLVLISNDDRDICGKMSPFLIE